MADFVCKHSLLAEHRRGLQERAGQEAELRVDVASGDEGSSVDREIATSAGARRRPSRRSADPSRQSADQGLSRRAGARRCQPVDRAGRDHGAARRKRRRQVDADPDSGRRSSRRELYRRASASPAKPTARQVRWRARARRRGAGPAGGERRSRSEVAENICAEPRAAPLRHDRCCRAAMLRARAALRNFGLDVDPAAPMASLDLATQQLVIIARALAQDARVLILDEPTAALTEGESHRLFDRMRALRREGVAIIFVSHRLAEVFAISDRIVVMRDGRICGDHRTSDVSRADDRGGDGRRHFRGGARPTRRAVGAAALAVTGLRVFDPAAENRLRVERPRSDASARARSSACSACSAPARSRRRWRSMAPGRANARARSASRARPWRSTARRTRFGSGSA